MQENQELKLFPVSISFINTVKNIFKYSYKRLFVHNLFEFVPSGQLPEFCNPHFFPTTYKRKLSEQNKLFLCHEFV